MVNNQENTDKKVLYCPNSFFNNGEISIGEFKTFDEAMNFPIKEVWCINRTNDNKFQAYQSQSTRILIICNWSKSIQDSTKFVVALVFCKGKITYGNDIAVGTAITTYIRLLHRVRNLFPPQALHLFAYRLISLFSEHQQG